jgi:hypothetical protein
MSTIVQEPQYKELFNKAIDDLIIQHRIVEEELTSRQLASAFKQALAAGDFQKLIAPNGGQAVVYMPYLHSEHLKAENQRLTELLKTHGIDPNQEDDDTTK